MVTPPARRANFKPPHLLWGLNLRRDVKTPNIKLGAYGGAQKPQAPRFIVGGGKSAKVQMAFRRKYVK